jgi:Tfp pilus assembly protein FimV
MAAAVVFPVRSPVRHHPAAEAPRRHRTAAVYWRRRFVAVALGLGLVVVVGQASAALGGSSLAPAERRPQVETVVVEPGDTLWSIAQRLAPGSDPRDVVDALVQARGTTALLPGETLTWLDD